MFSYHLKAVTTIKPPLALETIDNISQQCPEPKITKEVVLLETHEHTKSKNVVLY